MELVYMKSGKRQVWDGEYLLSKVIKGDGRLPLSNSVGIQVCLPAHCHGGKGALFLTGIPLMSQACHIISTQQNKE